MKFVYKLQKFMMSRYGPDDLYQFLLYCYIGLFILDLFVNSKILNILELSVVIILFYRFFSKNISRRRKENQQYLKIKRQFLKPFQSLKRNYQEKDVYVYKKCSKCKTTLRLPLPSKRGIQHVKCPKCKKKITFLCFREEKVEVIKNKRKDRK